MHTVTLGRYNISNTDNNRLVYDLPGSKNLEGSEIALSNLYMFYSWTNINSSPLNNNELELFIPPLTVDSTGAVNPNSGTTQYSKITIPDGLYEVADLNSYLQQWAISQDLYMVDTAGNNVYFFKLEVNPSAYAIQVTSYTLPTPGTIGSYTQPANGFGTTFVNSLTGGVGVATGNFPPTGASLANGWRFPANFNDWIGFPANTPINANTAGPTYYSFSPVTVDNSFPLGNVSTLSSSTPNVQPNQVIYLNCNLVSNKYANPSTFLYPVPAKVGVGQFLALEVPEYAWNKLIPGQASQLILTFTDALGRPIKILDPSMIINLLIRDHEDKHINMGHSNTFGGPSSAHTLQYSQHPVNNESSSQHTRLGRKLAQKY